MVIYDARPSTFTQLTSTGDWEYLLTAMGTVTAVDGSVGSAMVPSLDTGGRNAVIADGVVSIKGQLWRCDAPVNTAIPAASAQNRIDRLVLRYTRGATTAATMVVATVITGTPSGSPVAPPLVQTTTGIWDVPISHWTSTSAGAITGLVDDRRVSNDPWHDMRPLSNSFIGTVAGNYPPQYRFSDDLSSVEIAGWVQLPPSSGNNNNIVFFTIPFAYRPTASSNAGHRWPVAGVADGAATPVVQVDPTGGMQLHFMPASGIGSTIISIYGRYPLDDQNGMILT